MNGKNFGNSLVKFGFVAFALALGLAACGDGGSTNGPSTNHENTNISSVESEENLPSCTESREGFVRFIDETKEGFICKDRKWAHYDMIADVEENLPGCTGSREGLSAYLYEEDRELNCVEGSWDVVGEVASSSSSEKSGSSSSREKDGSSSSVAPNSSSSVIPGTDPGSPSSSSEKDDSSSSVALSSSSVILSSSSEESSSSVASSSSEESSSSVTSSSSVASSSSSSVIPGTDPESPSEVKDDGYYKTNCPAGLDCKYATTTDYLNSTKTYGEVLDTRDGQVYKTIVICDKDNKNCQTWMAQNLNYAPTNVSSMGSNAWSGCYGDVSANCSRYGRLYTWEVAMDNADCAYGKECNASLNPTTPVRGVCPQGWHLPSHYEFEELINYIDPTFNYNHTTAASSSTAGKYLKSKSGWKSSGNGSDAYGFSALPAGYRSNGGDFYDVGYRANFWSSGEYNSIVAFLLRLGYDSEDADLRWNYKLNARSVRCLKD